MRERIIFIFLLVSIGGFVLLNIFYQKSNEDTHQILGTMQLSEEMRQLNFAQSSDVAKAESIMKRYDSAKGLLTANIRKSQMMSSVLLFLIIIASSAIFITVILRISKPLSELKNATEQIRQGNFSVHLPETGISDMRQLKTSFNVMSRELQHIQNRLLLAEKEMIWKDLSRILAHEIKNPLTPIQLVTQRLEERLENGSEKVCDILPESISIISQEVENLKLLAQDFSNYAKVSQPASQRLHPASSLREIVNSYLRDYEISLDLDESLFINFDKTHFYQIVTNILQNAIDASIPTSSPISLKLYGERSFVVLAITDQGSGIDAEDLPRIFEPYFSRKGKGTGLGLALVKKLCEANKALIRVKSKKGEGSTFSLIIEGDKV